MQTRLPPRLLFVVFLVGGVHRGWAMENPMEKPEIEAAGASVESAGQALQSRIPPPRGAASVDMVHRALRSIKEHVNFNIFITVDEQGSVAAAERLDAMRARGEVIGPLHGLPIVVKDNIFVAGLPCTAGTRSLLEFVPEQDATVVKKLKAAGAVVLGKTNMHELAYGITGDNRAFGAARNARNPDYIGGGSSGGTAVAIALGIVEMGLGTDTGGSTRIPAALNGIVGFRPTAGRYPQQGLIRISSTRDTVGPMAASVAGIGLLDSILAGESREIIPVDLEGLRIGVPRGHFYAGLDAGVEKKIGRVLDALRETGVQLIDVELPGLQNLNEKVGFPVALFETGKLLEEFLVAHRPETPVADLVDVIASPDVKNIVQSAVNGDIPEEAYRLAVEEYRPRLRQLYRDTFSRYRIEALIFPTTPLPAIPIDESMHDLELGGETVSVFSAFIRNTDLAGNAGIPGLSIPVPVSAAEMPVGMEIDGPEGSDRRLIAIGAAMEALLAERAGGAGR